MNLARRWGPRLFACLLASVGLTPSAFAEPPASAPSYAWGRFTFAGGTSQINAMHTAIEEVVSAMNFVIRPIARSRLQKANYPSTELTISSAGGQIHVVRPGMAVVAAPEDGSFVPWTGKDGDEFKVRHRFVTERKLVQEFYGDGNHSVNIYQVNADGTRLQIHTTIEADMLPKALKYSMTYRREADSKAPK